MASRMQVNTQLCQSPEFSGFLGRVAQATGRASIVGFFDYKVQVVFIIALLILVFELMFGLDTFFSCLWWGCTCSVVAPMPCIVCARAL